MKPPKNTISSTLVIKITESRHIADKELENKAWSRVLAKDLWFGEKAAAYLTTNLMKAKRHLGMGLNNKQQRKPTSTKKKKKIGGPMSLAQLVHTISKQLRHSKGITYKENTLGDLKKYETKSLTLTRKRAKGKKPVKVQRVIPIRKTGGVLPLVPILARIAAVKTIARGVDTIVNMVKNIVDAQRKLFPGSKETAPVGKGMFLSRRNKGCGLFLDSDRRVRGFFLDNSKN